jgi:hypothetical protein
MLEYVTLPIFASNYRPKAKLQAEIEDLKLKSEEIRAARSRTEQVPIVPPPDVPMEMVGESIAV